jgi:hypothetical protein
LDQTPSPITCLGVQRLKGVVLDLTSRKVPRAGHERTHGRATRWGPHDWQVKTHCLEEGDNTLLTSDVSGIHKVRSRELDIETRKISSCEKCEGKVKPR